MRTPARAAAGLIAAVGLLLAGPAAALSVEYTLGEASKVRQLYPDASWLPKPYRHYYTDLATTIEHFTRQSLEREGIAHPKVRVHVSRSSDTVRIRLGPANATTRAFARQHQQFVNSHHGGQAALGVNACKATSDCWEPNGEDQPWALFLPLGLPLANQKAVLFLDYPPVPALTGRDYLNNFTMCRWGRVMGAAGADNPAAFEAIVDSRPIAAGGRGESAALPDAIRYFDGHPGGDYLRPMLTLLATPPGAANARHTLPVAVFGTPARKAWGEMTGQQPVDVLDVGTTQLADGQTTPWIATNHPDVTTYQTCPRGGGDTGSEDEAGHLVADEQKDFIAACWLRRMAASPGQAPEAVKQRCEKRWRGSPSTTQRRAVCVQAKLDTNDEGARCGSYKAARAYCRAHDNDPCATRDCRIPDSASPDALAALSAEEPARTQRTCNGYR